jgi:hypothetical protein
LLTATLERIVRHDGAPGGRGVIMARTGRGEAAGFRGATPPPPGRPGGGPSEAELEALLVQMREAPVEQVLAEVINVLFQTIQVKLGLADARILIDVVAGLAQTTAGRIDAQLHAQISQALSQLRLAQVEEEKRQGTAGASVGVAGSATGAPGSPAAASAPAEGSGAGVGSPDAGNAASRLWVPGR